MPVVPLNRTAVSPPSTIRAIRPKLVNEGARLSNPNVYGPPKKALALPRWVNRRRLKSVFGVWYDDPSCRLLRWKWVGEM